MEPRCCAGDVDADAVQAAARRLHGAGLVWEAAHLAGQAGQRATDRRDVLALQACARRWPELRRPAPETRPAGLEPSDAMDAAPAAARAGPSAPDAATEPRRQARRS